MTRSRHAIVASAALLLLFCVQIAAPRAAAAGKPDPRERARQLFVQGKKAYAAGKYADAIIAFESAGKIKASPILDFNVARCLDKLGQLKPALARYRAYLKARPKAKNRAEVDKRVKALEAAIAKHKADPYEDLEGGKGGAASKKKPAKKKVGVAPVGGAGVGGGVTGVAKVEGSDHGGDDVADAAGRSDKAPAPASQPLKVASGPAPLKASGPAEAAKPKKAITHEAALPIAMRAPPKRPGDNGDSKDGNSKDGNGKDGNSKDGNGGAADAKKARGSSVLAANSSGEGKGESKRGVAGKSHDGGKSDDGGKDKAGPIYKQWWFWVAIGAGVVITTFIIATAASGNDSTSSTSRALSSRGGGLTVLSF
ncbi:MAG: tetratricopeptide repeat protein [Myxococcales bacterium]|nr:tetratricopeptide repeat protein [Myxococcales bacterium]